MAITFFSICFSLSTLLEAGKSGDTMRNSINEHFGDFSTIVSKRNHTDEATFEAESPETARRSKDGCEWTCLPHYECKNTYKKVSPPGDYIDRFHCEKHMDLCCIDTTTVDNTSSRSDTSLNQAHSRQERAAATVPYQHPLAPSGCGHRNDEGVGFRIKGAHNNEAQYSEFPWTVAVLNEEPCRDCNSPHQCGGSVIGPKVVLTAAHCVHRMAPSSLKIRAGEWDSQTDKEPYPHQDRRVQEIIFHESYATSLNAPQYDIALLILEKPLEAKENIGFACLPKQDEPFNEAECYVTGWGKGVFGKKGEGQVIQKKFLLSTVSRSKCMNVLQQERLGKHFRLHQNFICAERENGKNTCKIESGSPLVCPIKSKLGLYAQTGIVNGRISCGEDGVPGVYINVAKFRHWIDGKIKQLELGTSFYTY